MRKIKRIVIMTMVVVVLVLLALVGQRRFFSGPRVKEPFTLNGLLDAPQQSVYQSCDTYRMIVSSSPYYDGNLPTLGQRTEEYQARRTQKVQQIRDAAAQAVTLTLAMRPKIEALRKSYFAAASIVDARDAHLKKFCRVSSRNVMVSCLSREVALAGYQSLVIPTKNRYAETAQQYRQSLLATRVGMATLYDMEVVLSASLTLQATCRESKDTQIQQAATTLDREMRAYDALSGDLGKLWASVQQVHTGLRQLFTGDYYLARSALAFMTQVLPDVRSRTGTLKPVAGITQDDLVVIQHYVDVFEQARGALESALNSITADKLVALRIEAPASDSAWGSATRPRHVHRPNLGTGADLMTSRKRRGASLPAVLSVHCGWVLGSVRSPAVPGTVSGPITSRRPSHQQCSASALGINASV